MKYNQGGIRNSPQLIGDFKTTRIKYISNHPWPFIESPEKLNLQNSQDIKSACIVVNYCYDLILSGYPILTEEQKQKLNSLRYPTYYVGILIIDNYISHIKCYIDTVAEKIQTESDLLAANGTSSDLPNRKQTTVKKNIIPIIIGIVVFLAALSTCIGYFLEWFEPIKEFIYNLFEKIKGIM